MDTELLQQALDNDDNLGIINTNIQEIKKKKNDILQKLNVDRGDLKKFHKQLNGYRYVDEIKDLKYNSHIRWINLKKIDNIKITNGAMMCDIKVTDNGIALLFRVYNGRYITLLFNEHLFFQKITAEEKILLKAVGYLNKA